MRPELVYPPFFLPISLALAMASLPLLFLGYAMDGIWSDGLAGWLNAHADFRGLAVLAILGAGLIVVVALLVRSTFLYAAGYAAFSLAVLVYSFNDSLAGGIGMSVLFVPLTAVFTILAVANFGQFIRSRPLLLLDEDGLECVLGRISWSDVTAVGVAGYEKEGREKELDQWLYLSLVPDAVLERVSERYYEGIKWGYYEEKGPRRDAKGRVELPLWKKRKSVLATVRRFYAGAIAERPEVRGGVGS